MKNACEGVLYPQAAASQIQLKPQAEPPRTTLISTNLVAYVVPHKAWLYCKEELENTFLYLKSQQNQQNTNPSTIFVLAPLHKGPIDLEGKIKIYTPQEGVLKGSDWEINLSTPKEITTLAFVQQEDDVCTEEHSLEIVAPFISKVFPKAQVCYLLAAGPAVEEICEITSIIGRLSPKPLILLSSNEETNCAFMWKSFMRESFLQENFLQKRSTT